MTYHPDAVFSLLSSGGNCLNTLKHGRRKDFFQGEIVDISKVAKKIFAVVAKIY